MLCFTNVLSLATQTSSNEEPNQKTWNINDGIIISLSKNERQSRRFINKIKKNSRLK